MNELQTQIILETYKDLQNPCKESGGDNRGACVNAIQKSTGVMNEAWCASYAYSRVSNACAIVKASNYLPRLAGAKNMLNTAKKRRKTARR